MDYYGNHYSAIPFYMANPTLVGMEKYCEVQKDVEYLMSIYPKDARRIQRFIEESLAVLEYPGSMIYDEYPDKVMLRRVCQDVIRRASEEIPEISKKAELIDVLLAHELLKRRHKGERIICNF